MGDVDFVPLLVDFFFRPAVGLRDEVALEDDLPLAAPEDADFAFDFRLFKNPIRRISSQNTLFEFCPRPIGYVIHF